MLIVLVHGCAAEPGRGSPFILSPFISAFILAGVVLAVGVPRTTAAVVVKWAAPLALLSSHETAVLVAVVVAIAGTGIACILLARLRVPGAIAFAPR
jgi:hypothetical protein